MKLWVDVDNPPQARYLLPLARHFREAGNELLITARAYGDTLAILESEGVEFHRVGESFGRGVSRKLRGFLGRARELAAFLQQERPSVDLVLTGSRSATLAARRRGIPSFVILDYEYVDLLIYQLCGSHLVFPDVIDSARFRRRGIPHEHLLPFRGLKEDISFADIDISSVAPHAFGENGAAPCVLFRPPAEESHYYRPESRDLALDLLRYLAARGARVVFSPRFEWQVQYLDAIRGWQVDPIVLKQPLEPVALLKGVDAVVSAGGTMLREAAYLGVPAYSVFRSRIGAVDRYLASLDRLTILRSVADFPRMQLEPRRSLAPLRHDSHTIDEVLRKIVARAETMGI